MHTGPGRIRSRWVQSRYELHGAAVKNADATSLYAWIAGGWETSGPRFIIPNLDYSLYRLILIRGSDRIP